MAVTGAVMSADNSSEPSPKEASTNLVYYIRHGSKKKLVWFLLLFFSLGMLSYNLAKITIAYTSNSIVLSVNTKVVDKINFPALVICKGSPLRRSAIPEELFPLDTFAIQRLINIEHIGLRTTLANDYLSSFDNLQDFRKAGVNPHEFFLTKLWSSCIFGVHSRCSYPKDITETISTSYGGTCFLLNGKGNVQQREVGTFYGLSMILFVNQPDNIPLSSIDFGGGAVVTFNEPGEHGFPEFNGILISPGYLTRISLKKVKYKRLKCPYPSNCTDGEDIDLYYPGRYTTSNCKRSCMVRDSLEACGATDPLTMMLLNQTGKYKYRKLNQTTVECLEEALFLSTSASRRACVCPVPCNEVSYIPTISQTRWPSQADLPYFKQAFAHTLGINMSKLTDDFVYQNFIHLNVYFDELSYQEVEETKEWTTEKLISDIGGQLGIWLGASILSLFEFIESLLKMVQKHTFMKHRGQVESVQ